MIKQKPKLFSGFFIDGLGNIKRRIDVVQNVEAYELEDNKVILLFLNLTSDEVLNKKLKGKIVTVSDGNSDYIALPVVSYDRAMVKEVIEELTSQHGLSCVGGMQELKQILYNDIIHPILHPEDYKKFRLALPNGILLFGPPGCGKTFIVKKLAEEIGYSFFDVKHSDVGSAYIHETAKIISKLFQQAKAAAPSIVFIDELEGLVPKRDSLGSNSQYKQEEINEFLLQLNDAGKSGVLAIGATNRPNLIDSAVLRSGRFDKRIYVPPPDEVARTELFKLCLAGRPVDESVDLGDLAKRSFGYSCSDIELLVNDAARVTIRKKGPAITKETFDILFEQFTPSITEEEVLSYEQFRDIERA